MEFIATPTLAKIEECVKKDQKGLFASAVDTPGHSVHLILTSAKIIILVGMEEHVSQN